MAEEPVGILQAQQAMSYQSRWPMLRLGNGDRGRFHFLTTGNDRYMAGGKFHFIPSAGGRGGLSLLCLREFTRGAEGCRFCDSGHSDIRDRFGVWVYAHYILHLGDNPEDSGERWKQVTVQKRTFFQEILEKPLLIDMAKNYRRNWFNQFLKFYNEGGSDLSKHLYELQRVGVGRDDTDYTLRTVKAEVISAEHAKAVDDLPNIEAVWRESLGSGPMAPALGSDVLDGAEPTPAGELEELPGGDEEVEASMEPGELV